MDRHRRVLVAAVAAGAAALVLGSQLVSGGNGDGDWRALNDDASGITVSYPREWKVQPVGRYCFRIGPGLLISNVRGHRFENFEMPNGCATDWEFTGLPNAYVLVDVSLVRGPPGGRTTETAIPLELDRFDRPGGSPNYAFTRVIRDGNEYSVRAWFGPKAALEDRGAVARVIRSIEFGRPHLA
jgi:hypothetical protein